MIMLYNVGMEEVISISVPSHNTLSTRREGLDDCLKGLKNSINYFNKLHPEVKVIICLVDDASTDNTYEYIKDYLINNSLDYKSIKLEINSHQGYCRNLAAKLVKSDYLMWADSDDVFLENHIKVCYDIVQTKDSAGRYFALGSTLAKFDPDLRIHPDWFERISSTIPITKIIRREVWEFLEGFPNNDIYKVTGCEDEDFMKLANHFFGYLVAKSAKTVEYRCYPGSFFERQLTKFRKHPNFMEPDTDDYDKAEHHRIRQIHVNQKLEYLKNKLVFDGWYNKLEHIATLYT